MVQTEDETRVCGECKQEIPYRTAKAYEVIYGPDYRINFHRLAKTAEVHMKVRAEHPELGATDGWIGIEALLTLVDIERAEDIVAAVLHRQCEEAAGYV